MDEVLPDSEYEPRTRPTGVSVIAALGMIFGALSFFMAPISLGQLLLSDQPAHVAMRADETLYYFLLGSNAVNWIASILLIALGIGLWKLKPWARSGAVIYCAVFGLWTLLVGAFSTIYLTPKILDATFAAMPQKLPPEAMNIAKISGMVVGGCSIFVVIGIYIFIAYYLSRPNVKEIFRAEE